MFFPSLLSVLALLSATAVANPLANRHAWPAHPPAAASYCPRRAAGPVQQKEIFAAFVKTLSVPIPPSLFLPGPLTIP